MNRKTICMVASHYLPDLGGVEKYTYHVAQELTKLGYRVIIVTSECKGQPWYQVSNEAEIIRLKSWSLMHNRFPIPKLGVKFKQVAKYLDHVKIDYMIIHTRFYVITLLAAFYASKRRIKTIVIEHGTAHIPFRSRFVSRIGQVYEHIITTLIKKWVKDYYGVSEACVEWLKHFGIRGKGVFHNSIDLDAINSILLRAVKEKSSAINDEYIITFTGRLIEEKGVLKLCDAVDSLKIDHPNTKLMIAGDGPIREAVVARQNDNICYLGLLKFDEIIRLLAHTEIYCLPTEYPEGFPTAILEAIACRCYVISTMYGGTKELICSDGQGKLLETVSESTIRDAIEYIMMHEQERIAAIESVYIKMKQEYVWSCTVKKIINVIEGL